MTPVDLYVYVVTVVKKAVRYAIDSAIRIFTGQAQNPLEKALAQALREAISSFISRSRLMNPASPLEEFFGDDPVS